MKSMKHSTLRRRLAAGIALSMSLTAAPQLLAQGADEDGADNEPREVEVTEEVIVTGSRVVRDTVRVTGIRASSSLYPSP